MVCRMATTWRGTYRSDALFGVAGLLLLAMALVASAPAWYGGNPAHLAADQQIDAWDPGARISHPTTPPLTSGGPEHLPVPLPRHLQAREPVLQRTARTATWPDGDAIRSPQRSGQRTSGSRSPPTA